MPSTVDLRDKFWAVYDQGQLGSCTANAGCGAYNYISKNPPDPSRLFLYFNERVLDGDISEDAGSSLHQCVNALETFGVCSEILWPYDISKFAIQPPQNCYNEAKQHEVIQAKQINQSINAMKSCLAGGYPFIFGIDVYSSFESDQANQTGVIPMPTPMINYWEAMHLFARDMMILNNILYSETRGLGVGRHGLWIPSI